MLFITVVHACNNILFRALGHENSRSPIVELDKDLICCIMDVKSTAIDAASEKSCTVH